jgi:hypothetical protein
MLSPMSPTRRRHEESNGLLMQEPKRKPDNDIWRHMRAYAGLFLVRRAAMQSLGAPAVYTKTAHERSDNRRPPTIDHNSLDGISNDPGIIEGIPRPAAPPWEVSGRPVCMSLLCRSIPKSYYQPFTGRQVSLVPTRPRSPVLSTQGRSHRLWSMRDCSVTLRRTK